MAWSKNANKLGAYLSLNDILQIYNSYRLHYHETYVDFLAAYLSEMKQLVFIRGGNATLIHKVLKYPDIELVLGPELDQEITLSFCHVSIYLFILYFSS